MENKKNNDKFTCELIRRGSGDYNFYSDAFSLFEVDKAVHNFRVWPKKVYFFSVDSPVYLLHYQEKRIVLDSYDEKCNKNYLSRHYREYYFHDIFANNVIRASSVWYGAATTCVHMNEIPEENGPLTPYLSGLGEVDRDCQVLDIHSNHDLKGLDFLDDYYFNIDKERLFLGVYDREDSKILLKKFKARPREEINQLAKQTWGN